jgi:hypothetical protein
MKQCVRFKGDFEKEKTKDELPGEDLAEFIAGRLREKYFAVEPVENEEIWFTVKVISGSIEYPLMVCRSSINEDYWEISCPRKVGTFARLLGKSEETELQNLTNAIDEILRGEEKITEIKWYGDYDELCDDYAQKRGEKRLITVGNYFQKLFLPLCGLGMALIIVGAIRRGKDDFLLWLGGLIFSIPFIGFLVLFFINILWALIEDIRESFQKRTKKKWLRWLFAIFLLSLFIIPFLLGILRNPSIERTIEKNMFRFMVLSFFSIMVLSFGAPLIRSFFKIFIPRYREKNVSKNIFLLIGSFLVLMGFTGFLSGFFAALGMLKWVPQSVEFPLAAVEGIDVDREGILFVASSFYSRIQVYNSRGKYIRGWFLDDTGGGQLKIKVNNENKVEVAIYKGRKIDVFDEKGKLIESRKLGREDLSFWDSFEQKDRDVFDETTKQRYSVEGWFFPGIIQEGPNGEGKIGRNAFYLFPVQGPFQGWITAMAGMVLMGWTEKKKTLRRK